MSYHKQSINVFPQHQIKRYYDSINSKVSDHRAQNADQHEVVITNRSNANINVNIVIEDKPSSNSRKKDAFPVYQSQSSIAKRYRTQVSMDQSYESAKNINPYQSKHQINMKNNEHSTEIKHQQQYGDRQIQVDKSKNLSSSEIANEFSYSKSSIISEKMEKSFKPIQTTFFKQSPEFQMSSLDVSKMEKSLIETKPYPISSKNSQVKQANSQIQQQNSELSQSYQSSQNQQFPSHFYSKEIRNSLGRQRLKQEEKQAQELNVSEIIEESAHSPKNSHNDMIKIQDDEPEEKNIAIQTHDIKQESYQTAMYHKQSQKNFRPLRQEFIKQTDIRQTDNQLSNEKSPQQLLHERSPQVYDYLTKTFVQNQPRPNKIFQNIEIISIKKPSFNKIEELEAAPPKKHSNKWKVERIEETPKEFIILSDSKKKTYAQIMRQKQQYLRKVEESRSKERSYDRLSNKKLSLSKDFINNTPKIQKNSKAQDLFQESKRKYLLQLKNGEKCSNTKNEQLYQSYIDRKIKLKREEEARSKSKASNRSISPRALQISERLHSDRSREGSPCKYYRKWNIIADRQMFYQIAKDNMFVQKYLTPFQIEDVFNRLISKDIQFSYWGKQIVNEAYKKMNKISKRQNQRRIHKLT